MKNELLLYANYYHNFGMNISPINAGNYKNPMIENWRDFIQTGQEDLSFFKCDDTTGIGLILGYNGYRALDIDSLYCSQEDLSSSDERKKKVNKFISDCLAILGLPQNYQWVIDSGSGRGIHIIFRTNDFNGSKTVYSYSPNSNYRNVKSYGNDLFKRIELRWKAFLVLPPSLHKTHGCYFFHEDLIPTYAPSYVSKDSIYSLLNHFCGDLYFEDCTYKNDYHIRLARISKRFDQSSNYIIEDRIDEVENSIDFLKDCISKDAFNTMGVIYALGQGVQSCLIESEKYFKFSNNAMAHFNMASLIACGAIIGSEADINYHLGLCLDYPDDELDLIKSNFHKRVDSENRQPIKHSHNKYLFFDTETTGLPKDFKAPSSNTGNWPRLVQLSWIVTDDEGIIISEHDYIIYPNGFNIPKAASDLHGITMDKARANGEPIEEVINLFLNDFYEASYIVGHNVDFDKKIIGSELYRLGRTDVMDTKQFYCTMELSIDYCKIPGYYGYKFPKLHELHKKLFDVGFENAHNSAADVKATVKCFWEMSKRGLVSFHHKNHNIKEDKAVEIIQDIRKFTIEELAAVKEAVVVPTRTGMSIQFSMLGGGVTFIPLESDSDMTVGECIDLSKAELVTLQTNDNLIVYKVRCAKEQKIKIFDNNLPF